MNFSHVLVAISAALSYSSVAQNFPRDRPVHSQPMWEARHIRNGGAPQEASARRPASAAPRKKNEPDGIAIGRDVDPTFDTRLDAIVKGERFFNVEKFPTMTFVSSKLTFDGDRGRGGRQGCDR